MSLFNSGKISRILSRIGVPTSSTIAGKVDALHDSRITAGRAAKLDNCDASIAAVKATVDNNLDAKVSDAGAAVPIEIVGAKAVFDGAMTGFEWVAPVSLFTLSAVGVWQDAQSYSGSGIIQAASIDMDSNTSNHTVDARFLVDGVVVWSKTALFTSSTQVAKGLSIIGHFVSWQAGITFENVRFKTGFNLQVKRTGSGGIAPAVNSGVRYQKWT